MALFNIVLMFFTGFVTRLNQLTHSELIIYNNTTNPVIQLIAGRENYVISEDILSENDFIFRQIETIKTKKHLFSPVFLKADETFESQTLFLKNGLVVFEGKVLLIDLYKHSLPNNPRPDYIITNKSVLPNSNLTAGIPVYVSLSNTPSATVNSSFYPVKKEGAYVERWRPGKFLTNAH